MNGGALPDCFTIHRAWACWTGRDLPALVASLPLVQREIKLYGQTLKVPRLTAWMGEAAYTYSGIHHEPAAMPAWLAEMRGHLDVLGGASFNSVLANYYRDGSDSVAWHADDEPELGKEPTIASVSLGASRRFAVRTRDGSRRWDVVLEHGDLLVMSGRAQLDYLHSVPKTSKTIGPRLNLTFRQVAA